jgi:hypothetical protein
LDVLMSLGVTCWKLVLPCASVSGPSGRQVDHRGFTLLSGLMLLEWVRSHRIQ